MHPDTLNGPLAIFLQGLAFVLVAGALFVLVHALGRKAERWKHFWSRWVWVVLAAEYVLSFAAAMIVSTDITATVFGISYVVALVVDVAYLLRVVFPAKRIQTLGSEGTVITDAPPEVEYPIHTIDDVEEHP